MFLINKKRHIVVKQDILKNFCNVIGVHLLKETNMKQFYIQNYSNLFHF
jgi:hypothetical protein